MNRHRARAGWVYENRHWLPDWFIVWHLGRFCEAAEAYLDGNPPPPSLLTRIRIRLHDYLHNSDLADIVRHGYRPFRKADTSTLESLVPSLRTEGPLVCIDPRTGQRAEINHVLKANVRPSHLADIPRPNCPKCGRSHPELGTPLNKTRDGWGDSFFTCSDHSCQHRWKWKKTYPTLVEDNGKVLVKGNGAALKLEVGLSAEDLNRVILRFARLASEARYVIPALQTGRNTLVIRTAEGESHLNEMPLAKKHQLACDLMHEAAQQDHRDTMQ